MRLRCLRRLRGLDPRRGLQVELLPPRPAHLHLSDGSQRGEPNRPYRRGRAVRCVDPRQRVGDLRNMRRLVVLRAADPIQQLAVHLRDRRALGAELHDPRPLQHRRDRRPRHLDRRMLARKRDRAQHLVHCGAPRLVHRHGAELPQHVAVHGGAPAVRRTVRAAGLALLRELRRLRLLERRHSRPTRIPAGAGDGAVVGRNLAGVGELHELRAAQSAERRAWRIAPADGAAAAQSVPLGPSLRGEYAERPRPDRAVSRTEPLRREARRPRHARERPSSRP